jgi:hypothetical protein
MPRSSRRPPLLVRTLLLAIRLVSVLVPRPDRRAWRQEWEAEILHGQQRAAAERRGWRGQTPLVRHSLGSLADAAWLRRQFTGDAEMIHDLRHTLRLLAARPAFTLVATLVLALGIGASTAVVSLVDALLLREPPFPDADRIVAIWERDTTSPAHRREVAPANFLDWRAAATTMDAVAAVEPWSVDYTGGDRPRVFMAAKASEGFFDILGVRPLHGRLFHPDDFTVRQGKVVVLAHALWQREFGGDPSIVHRAIPLDGEPHTVVGVLPPAFEMTLWLSEDDPVREAWIPRVLEGWERTTRSSGWWAVVAKMKDGVTIDEARAEFDGISRRLAAEHPDTNAHVVARGRTFTAEDGPDTERVAVISRSLARRLWGDEDPTGAWVTAGQQTRVRIVGVVGELRHDGYDGPPRDELFLAQGQVGMGSMTYVLRASGDPASVIGPAQEVIWSLDPLQTIYDTATVPELLAASVAPRRFALAVMAAFAVVALAVAAAGLYGVMSVAAGQRTREFGVRLALGASPREIAVLVLSSGLRLGVAGVAAGLTGAYAGARLFEQQLFDISAADPLAFGATAVVVLLAGLAASWLPARRATRVDPLVALRGSGLA